MNSLPPPIYEFEVEDEDEDEDEDEGGDGSYQKSDLSSLLARNLELGLIWEFGQRCDVE